MDKNSDKAPAKDEKADEIKALKKRLLNEYPNLWGQAGPDDKEAAFAFAEEYKRMISLAKTEREYVTVSVEALESLGFKPLDDSGPLSPGDKVYKSIRHKGLVAAVIGSQPASAGFNLLGAHIDSPRLDLKPNPVYEDSELAFFKTHYYGGIKKYQWTAIPLALHGIVIRKDGSPLTMCIGESPDDPVLTITDLLPHLGADQMSLKASEVIKGEDLNVLAGGIPYPDKETSCRFKLGLLQLLEDRFGIYEKDLVSAEIEIVPAGPARDVGLDASFIGAYGHDDRVCAFPALAALTSIEKPEKTILCLLYDKEETGSDGNTGAQSKVYEYVLMDIFMRCTPGADHLAYCKMLEKCQLLSADVVSGYDPSFASVSDSKNNNYVGRGIGLIKYVGARGKSGTNDANAEYYSRIIRVLNESQIPWQTGEMGKIDIGGGGTVAKYLANVGMEVLDCGVPVLSMHSPFEVISKIDLYFTYLAYKTFLEKM
jgi:aspartyl aminopeptidase